MQMKLTAHLVQHIASKHFTSKRALAEALCVPYRALLNVSIGNGSAHITELVSQRILRYCVEHKIQLVAVMKDFRE